MARHSNTALADDNTTTSNEDETVTTAVAPATEATENPEAPEVEDEVVDTSSIHTAVQAVLSGDLSNLEALDFSGVSAAYAGLTRKGKSAATRELNDLSKELLEAGDFDKARVVLLAAKSTKPAKGTGAGRAPRTPADVTVETVNKLAAFQLAYGALISHLPAGVSADYEAQVKAAFDAGQAEVNAVYEWATSNDENRGDFPSVSGPAATAARLAFGARPARMRHDVGKHIEQVFADKPSGTFLTVTEIANSKSDEYGSDTCTPAAVTARLDSAKPLSEGLSGVEQGDKRGVAKA